ncbi:MAG: hypothetical protein ACR2GS_09580 [Thermomicrobiales bacterium]
MIAMLLLSSMVNPAAGQQSDPPDPKVNVHLRDLTLDCDGKLAFTSEVIVDYVRFESFAAVLIYDGDPDAGGTPMWVDRAPLPEGETIWTASYLYTQRHREGFDPWLKIEWHITAWDGESGLDYVGNWIGAEKAPASDCSGVDPTPTATLADQLVATLKRILSGILSR